MVPPEDDSCDDGCEPNADRGGKVIDGECPNWSGFCRDPSIVQAVAITEINRRYLPGQQTLGLVYNNSQAGTAVNMTSCHELGWECDVDRHVDPVGHLEIDQRSGQ